LHQHEIARELGVSRRTVVNHLAAFAEHARKFLSKERTKLDRSVCRLAS
jgi:predicted transcriptional regulator